MLNYAYQEFSLTYEEGHTGPLELRHEYLLLSNRILGQKKKGN